MTPDLLNQIKAARRVSVPIIAITTPDPAATIKAIVDALPGGPMLQWDIVEGFRHLNEAGKVVRGEIVGDGDTSIANPVGALHLARKLPGRGTGEDAPPASMLFIHMAGRLIADPMTIQAAWNLRDIFKRDQRMLVLLSIDSQWPPELSGDIVAFDEPLPAASDLQKIIVDCHAHVGLPISEKYQVATLPRAVEAVQGLPAFQAEQVVAMSLTRAGVDVPALWERKRRQIELTPGLKVQREQTTFSDIGGVDVIKTYLANIMTGQARPNAIVFVDEIEKFLAGATGGNDSSGISQDQLGQLLSYMQDHSAAGCIFVGPPGAAKSAVAKAAGNEGGIPTIQLDLGAMKGSLVGASEQALRNALKVITSVSNGRSLWIATCNSIRDLPPELRRRFTLGTFFFDLPDDEERKAIWKIWLAKYGHKVELTKRRTLSMMPDDAGYTGAEIRQCCDIAWRLGCSLVEASRYVVPVSRSASDQLDKLRRAADGRFLSASKTGVYTRSQDPQTPSDSRRMQLED